jgi:long-chain acyl-CoA synthetase
MTSSQIQYILDNSEAKICFVSTRLIAEKIIPVFDELTELKYVIAFNKFEDSHPYLLNLENIIYRSMLFGKEGYSEEEADRYFEECSSQMDTQDILTIIYTSGTTGTPKGVCLTHKNILTNVFQCQKAFPLETTDRFLSFLPFAHSYERTTGYYFGLYAGAEVYYAQNIDTIQQQLLETKPTIITAVPLLFSRIFTRLVKSIQSMPKHRQVMVRSAIRIGRRYRNNKSHVLWKTADKLVFKTVRERMGGCMRYLISGGSALNKELGEFFDSLGIIIYEGYGMTEASPVISVNRVELNKYGTVGKPLDGTKVKIADDGEILVKGDTVMSGYHKNEKETRQTIIDGWLHTGDIGHLDEDNYLTITDRKKTLIKSEGGEYISLTHIEDTLSNSNFIDQVITFAGDDKPFVTALIVPDFNELITYSQNENIEFGDFIELIKKEKIIRLFESEINKHQKSQPKFTRVRKFVLMPRPFNIERGEMTPTLKLKRKVIEEKHKDIIEHMYKVK